ncbi:MAG: NAD-dependent epimerase/dehydratase family protein [Flavobacteriales bacterium]|nr:NAD-dependent epimerase/dehydratase family protein [Flavobacteriales bacterium]
MIAVTGGSGFLGAHLLLLLTQQNDKIKASRRKNTDLSFARRVFDLYSEQPDSYWQRIQWEEVDLLDRFELDDFLADVNQLYHCAAEVSFEPSKRQQMMQSNVKMTAAIVNQCLLKEDIRLCHVSSIAAIGRSRLEEPIAEDRFWKNDPNNTWYAISKYFAEREVWRGIEEGLNAVIINPAIILGYTHWDEGSGKFFDNIWRGTPYYTKGITGWVDVHDVAKAMVWLMSQPITAERFILSEGNHAYREILNMIADALHKPRPDKYAGRWLSGFAWRIEKMRSWLTKKEPLITKETAITGRLACYYENKKWLTISPFPFTPIKETIAQTASLFMKERGKK